MEKNISNAETSADSCGTMTATVSVNPLMAVVFLAGAFIATYSVKLFVDKYTMNKKD